MSTKFEDHLFPKGRSATEPDLLPSVKDSDGNDVLFNSPKRKTTQATVVNLGSAPNSNDGDPLRTSFGKINNFIEASYWVNESINKKFRDIDSELNEGMSIYADSDIRVDISLLENTKLKFSGTTNQIETNIQTIKSPNSTNRFDSEVIIKFQLTETVNISTLNVLEHAQFDSDVNISGSLVVDSDTRIGGTITVGGNGLFQSNVRINGRLDVYQEANFYDDAFFMDNAYFDSDVTIAGNLTVTGTTTHVNSQNLEVQDNIIVLNKGQNTPFNDIGFIFQRYDSDTVSSANFNTALVWDELTDQFIFGQSQSSGILPNPTLTQQYLHIGQTVEFFDSENHTRMFWDKDHATFKILFEDGTTAFQFNADTGEMTGNGTIDAGLF